MERFQIHDDTPFYYLTFTGSYINGLEKKRIKTNLWEIRFFFNPLM